MPLHYNITEVYSLSNKKMEIIQAMIVSFIEESENTNQKIKKAIKKKKYNKALRYSVSLLPSVELFGLDTAQDNLLRIIDWAKTAGKKKEIRTTYKDFESQVKAAIKELQKDYQINLYLKEL